MSKMAFRSKIDQAIPELEHFKGPLAPSSFSKIWLSSKMKIWLSPRFACTFFFGGEASMRRMLRPQMKKVQANSYLRKIFDLGAKHQFTRMLRPQMKKVQANR
jgi:hypothetical protein